VKRKKNKVVNFFIAPNHKKSIKKVNIFWIQNIDFFMSEKPEV